MNKYTWKSGMALVLALLFALSMIGCSAPAEQPAASQEQSAPAAPAAVSSGELVLPTLDMRDVLVVGTTTLGNEAFTIRQRGTHLLPIVHDPLFRSFDITAYESGEEDWMNYPNLAESYTVSDDGMTYTIKLREGVQFQGGYGEMTAEDVVYSFGIVADTANESGGSYYFDAPENGGYIKSYRAEGPYTVIVELSRTYPLFISDMTDQHLNVYCKKYIEEVGLAEAAKHPIGTGPWEFVEQVAGEYMLFKAYDNCWRGTPEFGYLELRLVADTASQILMLKNGELDLVQVSAEDYDTLSAAGINIIEVENKTGLTVVFGGQYFEGDPTFDPSLPWANHSEEPEDSAWNVNAKKVRQALCESIDYTVVQDVFLKGFCGGMAATDFPVSSSWTKADWKQYEYNPEHAKQLLAEAGYADGFEKPIQMLISNTNQSGFNTPGIGEYIASCFEALGLQVDRVIMDTNEIHQKWRVERDTAWCVNVTYNEMLVEPTFGWPWNRTSTAPDLTIGCWHNIDAMVADVLETMDDDARKEKVQETQQWLYDNYVERPLACGSILWAASNKVAGWDHMWYYESSRNFTQTFEHVHKAS